jgi:hypothetical protein
MRLRRLTGIAVLLGLSASCDALTETDTTSSVILAADPVVEIDPAEFLKTCEASASGTECELVPVVCADLPGAMQSYVVTFTDLGPEGSTSDTWITLPSSPPTPCSQRVAFAHGITDHRYVADIDGYEQPASEIVPACSVKPAYAVCADDSATAPLGNGACQVDTDCFANGCYGRCVEVQKQRYDTNLSICVTDTESPASIKVCDYQPAIGDRHMVVPGAWTPVTPRWATPSGVPCGFRSSVPASPYERIAIGPCDPLEDHGASPTGIVVRPDAAVSSLGCVRLVEMGTPPNTTLVEVGTITKVDVVPADTTIPPQKGLDCLTAGDVVFDQGIAPGSTHVFSVFAYDAAHLTPTYRATCVGTAIAGVIAAAQCVPVTPIGP